MLQLLTYKKVLKLDFPVYKFPSEDYYFRDGLLIVNDKVVDDRNQAGKTLGQRRLQTPHKLARLAGAYQEFIDLVRDNPPVMIDSSGRLFKYNKTQFETVRSYKIKKKELRETHTRVWLHSVNFCFIVSSPPSGKEWAQVLTLNNRPWLLYSFSEERQKEFKRKI